MRRLGDLVQCRSGGTPSRKNPSYWTGSFPWASGKDLKCPVLEDTQEHISTQAVESVAAVAPAGSILVLVRGMTLLNDVPVARLARSMAFNQDLKALVPSTTSSGPYIAHCLQACRSRLRKLVTLAGHGTGVLGTDQLLATPIPDLPLDSQRRLGLVLDSWDDLDRDARALIAARRRFKRSVLLGLMDGRARSPRFAGEPWRVTTFGGVGRVVLGATPATTTPSYWDGDIPWCTPTDVTAIDGPYIARTARRISHAGLNSCAAELLPPGSVVVCTRATIGAAAITAVPMATNQGFKSLVPHEGVDSAFLYYAVCNAHAELVRRGAGSTFAEVSRASFEAIPVPCPSFSEQRVISRAMLLMDAELDALRRMADAYRRLKRALLQKLMRGELALAED
jgi:type I restriction enzyme S subunit